MIFHKSHHLLENRWKNRPRNIVPRIRKLTKFQMTTVHSCTDHNIYNTEPSNMPIIPHRSLYNKMPDVEDHREEEPGALESLREHFNQEVTESWGDLVLILGCFITGLLDSAIFNVWSCFVSMQTGKNFFSCSCQSVADSCRKHCLCRPRCFWSA